MTDRTTLPAAPAEARPPPRSALRRLAAEPFLHFVFMGTLLFAAVGAVKALRERDRFRIHLDAAAQRALVSRWVQQYGTDPSAGQLAELVQARVREEVLYREGVDARLDRDDEIVRRRVAQKFAFLLEDVAIAPAPTEAALRAYYEAHRERYREPARADFTHVFFSADASGDADARRRAEIALPALQGGGSTRAPELGDRFPYLYDHAGVSGVEVARLFGDTPFAAAVLSAAPGRWSGPFRSGYGWHLLYVSARTAPALPPLAQVAEQVKADLAADERQRANAAAFEKLRGKYDVAIDPPEASDALATR